jgi:alpha-tubulin suppressor-like RCC1 family protein
VAGITDATRIAVSTFMGCAIQRSGAVRCWRQDPRGGPPDVQTVPLKGRAIDIAGAGIRVCALSDLGAVWCWGENKVINADGSYAGPFEPHPAVDGVVEGATALAIDQRQQCVAAREGAVWCWGLALRTTHSGDVARTTGHVVPAPVKIEGLTDARALALNFGGGYAMLGDGRVLRWDTNSLRAPGEGQPAGRVVLPTPLKGFSDAVSIAAGAYHLCARKADGRVVCSGRNREGQAASDLGDGEVPVGLVHF